MLSLLALQQEDAKSLESSGNEVFLQSGKKDQTTNWRPITALPILANIFEKLAHKRMICFINRFNLLISNQFGLLAGQNTSDALT